MPQIIEAERSSVSLPSDGLHLQIYTITETLMPHGTLLPINGSLAGQAFSSQRTVICDDLTTSNALEAPRLASCGLRSAIACPMVIGGRTLGTINLADSTPGFFTPEHKQELRAIVDLIASFMGAHERAESEFERRSTDHLTGSLSRSAILDHLDDEFATDEKPSLLYVDVDRFKSINDTHGHAHGDELLRVLSQRIQGVLRDQDRLGRLGGDEFLIVAAADGDGAVAHQLADEIERVCGMPVTYRSVCVQPEISIGIASVPDHVGSATELLNDADEAMYAAKRSSFSVAVADETLRAEAATIATIDRDLDVGLRTGEITHYFQPVRDMTTREIMGVEALVRWTHPRVGPVPPPLLVQRLERTGRTDAFTEWTLRTVAEHWTRARAQVPWFADKAVSVNMSPRQLAWPRYADVQLAITKEFGLRNEDIIVEVVESDEIEVGDAAEQTLQRLVSHGGVVALDDFGTGHNALGYFTRFTIGAIKFDRSLVVQASTSTQARTILAGLAGICHDLGVVSLGEGIETEAHARICQQLGITHGQGWHFGYPEPLEALIATALADGPRKRLGGRGWRALDPDPATP
jgi:diguanylate cyclase (GGDEF)-like protein